MDSANRTDMCPTPHASPSQAAEREGGGEGRGEKCCCGGEKGKIKRNGRERESGGERCKEKEKMKGIEKE